jgi:signal recognition particle receptor subunit beta
VPHVAAESRTITFKIVYAGPGLSGKTTNLVRVHASLKKDVRGEMLTLDTASERTLFFDFFPFEPGTVRGFSLLFYMYTVPGQVIYAASRRLVLEGADGVVFVADSCPDRFRDNIESWRDMVDALGSYGIATKDIPIVLQYNKRDCPGAVEVGSIERELELDGMPVFEAVATEGVGVIETAHEATRRVIQRFEV